MTPDTSNTSSISGVGISEDATLIRKAAEYFDAVGKREEARLLEAPLQASREATVVAVIGEVGCGKTMLVDALSGSASTSLSACETGFSFGPDAEEISGQGNFGLGEGAIRGGESLADDSFIDCPGFNGADSEISKAAIALTRNAGVVVFVLEATTTITEPELATLKEIAASTPGLVVAITKKDKNLLGWREIERVTHQQIQQHLGELVSEVPIVSVSPLRYLSALNGNPFLADEVINDSGIPRLQEAIVEARHRLQNNAYTPILRQALVLLNSEYVELESEISADSTAMLSRLEEKKVELEHLTSDRRRGQQLLTSGLSQARSEAVSMAESQLVEIREKWHSYFASTPPRYIRAHRDAVFFQIESELSELFEDSIRYFMARSREVYVGVTDGVADWHSVIDALNEVAAGISVSNKPESENSVAKVVDPSLVSLTIAGGFGLTHVLGFVPGIGAAIIGSGGTVLPFVAMAGLWLGVNVYHRSSKTGRVELAKWLDQVILQVRRQLNQGIETVYNELRPLLINQFNDNLELRIRRTKHQIQQTKQDCQSALGDRQVARQEAKKKSAYVARLRGELLSRVDANAE
ncbi:hypothetical protein AAFL42_01075 [Corynebacterium amycolatum]|uniref:hypothetical protein n=1 Tax=Corynebacterium amycolatum TaxID=43765 RepID=UPI00290E0D46|nr:hypothetical protein [Corynebacterium sp.]